MASKAPYITANALIRYYAAKAPERSRIISDFRDQEFPPFKGWYGETEGAVRRFLATGASDPEPLQSLENLLHKREIATDHEEAKILGQLHALEAIQETDLSAVIKHGSPQLLPDNIGPFFISGVRVSVRPTNFLSATKEGQKSLAVGAVKPYLASTDPLSEEAGLLYASLLHWYAEECLQDFGVADHRLSFVVDVFQKMVFRAPAAFKLRRENLKYSCQEIFERWSAGGSAASKLRRL